MCMAYSRQPATSARLRLRELEGVCNAVLKTKFVTALDIYLGQVTLKIRLDGVIFTHPERCLPFPHCHGWKTPGLPWPSKFCSLRQVKI